MYFPVPTIRREVKVRPATVQVSAAGVVRVSVMTAVYAARAGS